MDIENWILDKNFEANSEEHDEETSDEEGNNAEILTENSHKIKHADAINNLNNFIQWSEENDVSMEDLLVLQKLKELTVTKMMGQSKQTKIRDYFRKFD